MECSTNFVFGAQPTTESDHRVATTTKRDLLLQKHLLSKGQSCRSKRKKQEKLQQPVMFHQMHIFQPIALHLARKMMMRSLNTTRNRLPYTEKTQKATEKGN